MKKIGISILIIIILIIIGVILYMYWPTPTYAPVSAPPQANQMQPSANAPATTAPAAVIVQPQSETVVRLGNNPSLGNFLTAMNGMTLYIFKNDAPGVSNCSGQCAVIWPALLVSEQNVAGAAGIGGMVGTIEKPDGTYQATYNDMPLYFYVNDRVPGDTLGDGINNVWAVVQP